MYSIYGPALKRDGRQCRVFNDLLLPWQPVLPVRALKIQRHKKLTDN